VLFVRLFTFPVVVRYTFIYVAAFISWLRNPPLALLLRWVLLQRSRLLLPHYARYGVSHFTLITRFHDYPYAPPTALRLRLPL